MTGGPRPLVSCEPSSAQERLWVLERLDPGSGLYNVPQALELTGELQLLAFERALARLVERHETLRTGFETEAGALRQRVYPPARPRVPVIDLARLAPGAVDAAARRLAEREARRPFALDGPSLLRIRLMRLGRRRHVLLLVLHHAVADGSSLRILWRDLASLYDAALDGTPPALPELPIQYADWAAWQHQRLGDPEIEAQLAFWRRELADLSFAAELPADRPRPPRPSYRGATCRCTVSRARAQRLLALGREEAATPFMTLLAAFEALLSRLTNGEEMTLGTPVSGRTRVETADLVGLFVNTLVLRGDAGHDPTFRELLRRVRRRVLAALANQDAPFEKVVEAAQPERDASRSPLFLVMFLHGGDREPTPSLKGVRSARFPVGSNTTKFDLSVALTQRPEGLDGTFEYSTDLFDATTMARLANRFRTVVDALAEAPDRRLSEVPWLPPGERHQMRVEWPAQGGPAPSLSPVELAFVAQAQARPDAVAVVREDENWSYGQVERRARDLAGLLADRGVGPGVTVGIFAGPTVERVVGVLAVLLAGGWYLPLDPDYPSARLDLMLRDLEVSLVLTAPGLRDGLPSTRARVLELDATPAETGAKAPAAEPGGDDRAYVVYTSGSTGKPKGAIATRRGLAGMVASSDRLFGLTGSSRVLQYASFSFDVSVWETFMPLTCGGTLVLHRNLESRLGEGLLELLRRQRVNAALLTPSLMRLLEPRRLPDLEVVVSVGERCPREVAQRWSAQRRFFNCYGPAECSVTVSGQQVEEDGVPPAGPPIGRPFPGACLYVLARDLWPAGIGVDGELCIGGPTVGGGYAHRPALTAEAFVPDPQGAVGGRLYRTGDRSRWLASAVLEFHGRVDQQVKIRGHRVELREVEAALEAHPDVEEGVVMARPDPAGNQRLVAYLVPRERTGYDMGTIRDDLRSVLPTSMVPSLLVPLDGLPRSPNGKIDRSRLPAVDGTRPTDHVASAPRTALESRIVELWRQELGIDTMGVRDNFFDLGGNSLLLARVHDRLREEHELSMVDLFRFPTVESLARYLAGAGGGDEVPPPSGAGEREIGSRRLRRRRRRLSALEDRGR